MIKDSEKYHESEKSKKKSAQKLSSNASEISINQQVQIEQSSEKDNSEKIFTKKNERKNKSYIILMKQKNHLQSEISNTTTCINKKLRKASRIRKVKEKTSSRTIIKCIRNINKSTSTN